MAKQQHVAKTPRIKVVITQEMIDRAIQRDSNHCMIADGLKAAFPDSNRQSVDLATIRLTDTKRRLRYTYLTPRIAQLCLVNYDQGRQFEPFSFVLRSGQVSRAGANRSPTKISEEQKTRRSLLAKEMNEKLRKAKLVSRQGKTGEDKVLNGVRDRIGGKPAPVQKLKDGVPFSRRRAFGLRALEY